MSALFDGVAMDEKPNTSKHAGKASVIVSQLKGLQGEMSTLQDDI